MADAPVLRGVDLTVAAGEAVATIGPSGSGKRRWTPSWWKRVASRELFSAPKTGRLKRFLDRALKATG